MPVQKSTRLIFIIVSIILVWLGLTWANYIFSLQNPGGNDYLARWNGAHAWLSSGTSPYDPSVSLQTQFAFYGRPARPEEGEDVAHFVYPFYTMIFLAPFAWTNYPFSRALFMTFLEIGLLVIAQLGLKQAKWKPTPFQAAVLLLCIFLNYISVRSIILGQFAVINSLLIIAALYCIMRKRDIPAGILLSLSTCKPQMIFLLLPFLVFWGLAQNRKQLVISTTVSLVFLFVLSEILLPGWIHQWAAQLLEYPTYTGRIGSLIEEAVHFFAPRSSGSISVVLQICLVALLLVFWWRSFKSPETGIFYWTATLTLVITNLVALRTATPHYLVFIPLLFIFLKNLFDSKQHIRAIVWLFLLIAGYWILFLITVNGNVESILVYYPIPVLVLFGLFSKPLSEMKI
jgi:hypothetical protein